MIDRRRGRRTWWRQAGLTAGLAGLLAMYAVTDRPDAVPTPPPANPALTRVAEEDGPIRQTEAAAMAHAAAIGARVEIGAFRGESREVYANADGTTTAVEHAQPVRVIRDGTWVPVDATLVKGPDGSIAPKAATLGLRLSGGGDAPLVEVDRAGRKLTLDWPGRLPAPSLVDDRATYAEVLPGVDLVVNVGVSGFSHVLVIKNAEAAKNEELATLDFGLKTDGLTVRDSAEGGLTVVDNTTGGAVLQAATPVMWDSGAKATTAPARALARAVDPQPAAAQEEAPGSAKRAEMDVQVDADSLTLVPDRAMLTDPTTRWPVYVDPIWQDTRNSGWTMVASGYPNEEYWKFKDDEGVGECPVSSGWCNGTGVKRLFYALPTPYAGRTILSAEFRVTMVHTYDSSAKDVALYRAGSGISSGTNWKNQPALSALQQTKAPTSKQGSCTSTNQNVGFNVKAAVTEAASKGWATTTFGLRAENEADHTAWKRFCGNAILSVNYNRAPATPVQSQLTMSPGGACVYGATRPYVDTLPVLNAVLRDPDHAGAHTEQLRANFKVYWTPPGGTQVIKTFMTGKKASGSKFSYNSAVLAIPQNVVVGWEVQAWDDEVGGPWSTAGTQTQCQFVYDKTTPVSPDIDSPEYLPNDATEKTSACAEDDEWRGSIGTYTTFTFDSTATDVVEYRYGINTNPSPNNVLKPTADGGPVTLRWAPEEDGPITVNVQAVDRARRASAISSCTFMVATRPAVGEWGLGEAADAASAADTRGAHPATPGAGATLGAPGPACPPASDPCRVDRSVRLTGAADSYLATASRALVDTGKGFAVTAWVRLQDTAVDRVAVSQDGTGEPGFVLGFDGASKKWAFTIPVNDVDSLGQWRASSTAAAVKGQWTHLAAVYDAAKGTMHLYVDGQAQPVAQRRSAWKSRGAVQFGRRLVKSGYTGHWIGELADVSVFDRIIVPREVTDLAKLRPVRLGYWPLDDVSDDRSPEYDNENGQELLVGGGAQLYAPDPADPAAQPALIGAGHLTLDGVDDHARTEAAVTRTDGSFTVTARVRLASPTCGRNMTVVSQAGVKTSGFLVRCSAANRWELMLPRGDGPDAAPTTAYHSTGLPSGDQAGQHLALVYNAFLNRVSLYVDGQLTDTGSAPHAATWNAAGGLQVGRALLGGTYGEYFAGAIDDVRVFTGVADDTLVQLLAQAESQPDL